MVKEHKGTSGTMVSEVYPAADGGEEGLSVVKPLQRFKRLAGSLETLISSIAQDWENATTEEGPADDAAAVPTKPVHRQMRKAQLLFTELHSTTRKMHCAMEGAR